MLRVAPRRQSSAAHLCPLTALPAELSLRVFMLIELESKQWTDLLLVDRIFHSFIKTHEAVLVKNAAESQRQDPLAALLVLRSDPTFTAFFKLYDEQEMFHSIVHATRHLNVYPRCFPSIKDVNFGRSPESLNAFRPGFLIHHHRFISIGTCQGKVSAQTDSLTKCGRCFVFLKSSCNRRSLLQGPGSIHHGKNVIFPISI